MSERKNPIGAPQAHEIELQAIIDSEALALRLKGLSYAKMSLALQCSASTAYDRVQRALARVPVEDANEYRRIELERLDTLLEKVLAKATSDDKGFLFAVDRALAISESRRKLLGLDAPTRQMITVVTEDATEAAIRELEAQLAANAGGSPDGATVVPEGTPTS